MKGYANGCRQFASHYKEEMNPITSKDTEESISLPCESSPLCSPNQQMSAALKARLRKCGRWYASPKASPSQNCEVVSQSHGQKSSSIPTLAAECYQNVPVSGVQSSTPKSSTTRTHPYATPRNSNFRKRLGAFTSPRFVKKQAESSDSSVVSGTNVPPHKVVLANTIEEIPGTLSVKHGDNTNTQSDVTMPVSSYSKSQLRDLIKDKREVLRKLNLVKMYRKKNNLSELQDLIDKWQRVAQKAIEELCEISPEPKPSLAQILDYFQIDHSLVKFDLDEKSFKS